MGNTVEKVLAIAEEEVGYLEKSKAAYVANPQIIYSKTQGAGSDNYTKYGKEMHDVYPSVMDFPAYWCDAFVDWCFYKAYGLATAKSLLGGNFDDYTVASATMYQKKNALDTIPSVGAQIFFTKNGKISGCYHTGLVTAVQGDTIITIEGNTSKANSIVRNGGGVAKKQYSLKRYKGKVLFGHPKYAAHHNSISYTVGSVYKLKAYMSVRNEPSVAKKSSIIGSLPPNTKVTCMGVIKDQDGMRLWMQIKPNQYVCADNGERTYIE